MAFNSESPHPLGFMHLKTFQGTPWRSPCLCRGTDCTSQWQGAVPHSWALCILVGLGRPARLHLARRLQSLEAEGI